ncbi:MAG TPA: hypothetical protein VKP88_00480 [Candidatus Paceibacterota bacterium]|nr:hypothetical protein [Candidatus Paceibacterota bacterium]
MQKDLFTPYQLWLAEMANLFPELARYDHVGRFVGLKPTRTWAAAQTNLLD